MYKYTNSEIVPAMQLAAMAHFKTGLDFWLVNTLPVEPVPAALAQAKEGEEL